MYNSVFVAINPGLLPVVQVTEVDVAADTGQLMPSNVITYTEVSVGKFSPLKVTSVPPSTVPYLGEMERRLVVSVPMYSTELRSITVSPTIALASHV
jgi:hypothetical protein